MWKENINVIRVEGDYLNPQVWNKEPFHWLYYLFQPNINDYII